MSPKSDISEKKIGKCKKFWSPKANFDGIWPQKSRRRCLLESERGP